jgi:hypothetical protein
VVGSSPQREPSDNMSCGGDVHAFTVFLANLHTIILQTKTESVELVGTILFFKWLITIFLKEMRK